MVRLIQHLPPVIDLRQIIRTAPQEDIVEIAQAIQTIVPGPKAMNVAVMAAMVYAYSRGYHWVSFGGETFELTPDFLVMISGIT